MHCVSRGGSYLVNSHSDVQEADQLKRESFQAKWLDLVMETRPEHQLTLSEKDVSRRESYEQQQVIHFLVHRSLNQRLRLGVQGGVMKDHHHLLPLETSLPAPVEPQRAESPWKIWNALEAISPCGSMEGLDHVTNGVCVDKQEVSTIIEDLKAKVTKPIRVNFRASSLLSSPRETITIM